MGFATEFYQINREDARKGWEVSETQQEIRSTQPTHCRSPKSAITSNISAGFCSFPECWLSVCGVRLDIGFSSGPSFRPERARLLEERIFDLSRSLFEVRRFLLASARGEPESMLWRVFANGARRSVRAPNCWKAGVRFRLIGVFVPSRRRSLRFGDFRRRLPPRRRVLNGSLDSGSSRALSSATPLDFNGLSRMRGILARLGKRALRPE